MPFAIWNKKYKKWLYGTDFNCRPYRQKLSKYTPKLWKFEDDAKWELHRRECGKEYKVAEVMVMNNSIAESEAAKIVLEHLKKINLFCGTYDAKNGSEKYMYGIWYVMDAVAWMVSEKQEDEFDELFFTNMEKSEAKARKEQDNE